MRMEHVAKRNSDEPKGDGAELPRLLSILDTTLLKVNQELPHQLDGVNSNGSGEGNKLDNVKYSRPILHLVVDGGMETEPLAYLSLRQTSRLPCVTNRREKDVRFQRDG